MVLDKKFEKVLNKRNLTPNELERILKSVENAPTQVGQIFNDYLGKQTKIGIISDSHIGHKAFDEPFSKYIAKMFKNICINVRLLNIN